MPSSTKQNSKLRNEVFWLPQSQSSETGLAILDFYISFPANLSSGFCGAQFSNCLLAYFEIQGYLSLLLKK
jgi:hypothetical protein